MQNLTTSTIGVYATIDEYAKHRGVKSRTTVYAWINRGLPSIKQGRTRRIKVTDADRWIDAGNANFRQ
jgi:excisionase family DNA binding protein